MRGQAGFWDIDERCARLSEAGDPLEKLDALVPWEVFRKPLARALKRSDGAKGERPLGGLFFMDEAQVFSPSSGSTPSTRSTLALASQARKYGLGLIFATQAPKGLHNQIPGNATTQFFGFLNAPVQITAAKEMAAAKGGDVTGIGQLTQGQFFAASEALAFQKIRTPLCLTYHPASPLTEEEIVRLASSE